MDEPPSFQLTDISSGDNLLLIILAVCLLFFTALVSACEAACFALTAEDVDAFRSRKTPKANVVASLIANVRLLLTVLTTWKYLSLIGGVVLFSFAPSVSQSASLVSQILTVVLAFGTFGIALPKLYGSQRKHDVLRFFAGFCSFLVRISNPFIKGLIKMSSRIDARLEQLAEENSVKELTQVLELASADKNTTEDEKEILRGIVNFGTLTVEDVMRPHAEINSVDMSLNFHDLLIYIKKSGYSRIPVYKDDVDKIEGILYIKDLLPYLNETKKFAWQKLLRPAYFIPEKKKIDLLLKDFQEKRVHMALALDDESHISGIITLEDIIEEIIGDIHDEFDEVGAFYKKIDDKTFIVDSRIPVSEFCRILDVETSVFDVEDAENDTLGTVLGEIKKDLPRKGDQIIMDPFTLIIEAVDHKRIKRIKVQIHEEKQQ